MDCLDAFSLTFQDYFYKQIRRGLTFFVEASVSDLFEYMRNALVFGPYRGYAEHRLLSTTNAKRRLRCCIITVLGNLINQGDVKFFSMKLPAPLYYIPEVYENASDTRKTESKHIYNTLVAFLYGEGEGVSRKEIRDCIQEDYGFDFDARNLLELQNEGCIISEIDKGVKLYIINVT